MILHAKASWEFPEHLEGSGFGLVQLCPIKLASFKVSNAPIEDNPLRVSGVSHTLLLAFL